MAGFLDARSRVGYFYTGKTGSELLTEKVKKYKVKDFQSVPVVVKEDTSLYDAISTMFLGDVGTLFVVDDHSCLIGVLDRKSTRLNSSHVAISYAVFCLKKKKK